MIDISVIIINYNTEAFTINCLQSLLEQTDSSIACEFIIVDNGSQIESFKTLQKFVLSLDKGSSLQLIRSRINTGFGGGNMIGIQQATGTYLAFINNDTILKNDCLNILKKFMDSRPDVGICGPQAFTENEKLLPTIDHFASLGREILGRGILEKWNPEIYPKRKKRYREPKKGQFIAGSFMFIRAEDFYQVGGFDTNIFLYYEETDLCRRLSYISKSAYLVPDAEFFHYHGASTEKSVKIKSELKISLLYVIKKHNGLAAFFILLVFLQIKYFFSSLVKPKNWSIFYTLLVQAPLTRSLKHKQIIQSR